MNKTLLIGSVVASLALATASAQAQTIGAQINGLPAQSDANGGHDDNVGVLGEAFVNFAPTITSSASGFSASQLLGDGVTLTVASSASSFAFGHGSGYEYAPFIGTAQASTYGTSLANPTELTLTLSGLEAGATYSVAAYMAEGASQAFSFDGGATFLPVTGGGAYDDFYTAGENYTADLNVVADAAGTITIIDEGTAPTDGAGSPTYYAITQGIGVSFVSAAEVPEPSSLALMGLGLGFLGFFVRNRARFNS